MSINKFDGSGQTFKSPMDQSYVNSTYITLSNNLAGKLDKTGVEMMTGI